jgi:hypothetical protein
MIISYKHNFVFIKTRKTAGSSLEIALSTHAGEDDVVTPLGYAEEIERYREHPDIIPRNFYSDKKIEQIFVDALRRGDRRTMKEVLRREMKNSDGTYVNRHDSAAAALKVTGEPFWKKAYKFSVERHPYEKAVSLAWYQRKKRPFDDALRDVLRGRLYRNFTLYTIDGKLAVDFIVRYERLEEDILALEQAIGLPILARMARSNTKQRKDSRSAREILTDEQRAIIQETCRDEFEMFDYER